MAKREFTPAILFLSGLRMVAEYLQNKIIKKHN